MGRRSNLSNFPERRITTGRVLEIVRFVRDPGVPLNLEELGIVKEEWIHIEMDRVRVTFRPISKICPVGFAIGVILKYTLERNLRVEVDVMVLKGGHSQEALINEVLSDREKYRRALERLKESGLIRRCQI